MAEEGGGEAAGHLRVHFVFCFAAILYPHGRDRRCSGDQAGIGAHDEGEVGGVDGGL